ncbi:hypothetical protein BOX15_Mlig015879g1, partial [Macrostomum lignano]
VLMAGRGRPIQPAVADFNDEWAAEPASGDDINQQGTSDWSSEHLNIDVGGNRVQGSSSHRNQGHLSGNQASYFDYGGNEESRDGFGSGRGRGGFGARGGFGSDRNEEPRGGFDGGRGRGGFGARGGFGSDRNEEPRGGFDGGRGRGSFGARGGFGSDRNEEPRGGFDGGRGRGGFGARGGFGSDRNEEPRGGFDGGRGRGSFGARGGFGSDRNEEPRGGFDGGRGRGGFGARGGFDSDRNEEPRGGFGSGRGRGGFGSDRSQRGGFGGNQESDFDYGGNEEPRGGFGSGRARGGFEARRGFDSGRGRGGFGSDRDQRGGFSGNQESDFQFDRNAEPRGGFGGSRGLGQRSGFGGNQESDFDGGRNERSRGGFGGRGRGSRDIDGFRSLSREDQSGEEFERSNRGFGSGFESRDFYRRDNANNNGDSVCFRCQQPGHFARECTNSGAIACFNCGESGHFAAECPNTQRTSRDGPSAAHIPETSELDEIYNQTVHAGINFDNYEKIDVEVSGVDRPGYLQSFDEIGLSPVLMDNISKKFKYTKLTPVQRYAIPIVLKGRDLMACAQTGSGKTAAFILPMAKLITEIGDISTGGGYTTYPVALVLVPTRELCNQTFEFGLGFLAGTGVRIQRIYGGPKTDYLRNELANGCHILVATPGRLKDFAERNIVSLNKTRFLVLDEADQMLDRGFMDSVTWTLDQMPSNRQILMFSATFPGPIQALAQQYLQNYLYLTVGQVGAANPDVTQEVREVQQDDKQAALESVIDEWHSDPARKSDRILIFVETKRQADFVGLALTQKKQLLCTTIHGDRLQSERETAIRDFKRGKKPVMVATNVSARGVDINGIELVINMDLPSDFQMYVHRIGRTGRCGNTGKSISFYDHGRDSALALLLRQNLEKSGQSVPDWLDVYADQSGGGDMGGVGGFVGGSNRDMRRGVARDRFREQPDEGDFAESAFRPAPAAAQLSNDDPWD